jgi:DnaJ family protein A protein 5
MPERKRCYYEVLGVEETATERELTKAYRKMALLLHPDKNHQRQDAAAEEFKEVQNAYQVLNDADERAWYDSHKEQILSGNADGGTAAPDELNLYEFTSGSCHRGYGDDEGGFYAVFRKMFETVIKEDAKYQKFTAPPPPFGDSTTPYAEVQSFYSFWLSYSTRKTFAWKDEYKPSEFPDRFQRRAAERENDKARATARSEYNGTLRFVVNFVKRRDPRVKAEGERQEAIREEKERQRDLAQAEGIRKRQAEMKELKKEADAEEDAWAEQHEAREAALQELYEKKASADAERQAEEEEERRQEAELAAATATALRCEACKARFKTEKLMDEHVKSAKHKNKVKQMIQKGELPEGWTPGAVSSGSAAAGTAEDGAEEGAASPVGEDSTKPAAVQKDAASESGTVSTEQNVRAAKKAALKKKELQRKAALQAEIIEVAQAKASKNAPKKGKKGKKGVDTDSDDDEPAPAAAPKPAKGAKQPAASASPAQPEPAPAKGKQTDQAKPRNAKGKKGKQDDSDSDDGARRPTNSLAAEVDATLAAASKAAQDKKKSDKQARRDAGIRSGPKKSRSMSESDESSAGESDDEAIGARGGGFAALSKGGKRR